MKTTIKCIFVLIAALGLLGCATTAPGKFRIEPGEQYSKLLIGTIMYRAAGWGGNLDGTYYDGLSIKLENLSTKEIFEIQQTPGEKFFYKSGLPVGDYRLVNIVYKNNGSYLNWDITKFRIEVRDNCVTNIGRIVYFANKTTQVYRLNAEDDIGEIHSLFQTRFPESDWLNLPWNNVGIDR